MRSTSRSAVVAAILTTLALAAGLGAVAAQSNHHDHAVGCALAKDAPGDSDDATHAFRDSKDLEVRTLAEEIVKAPDDEIGQMLALLKRK